MRSTLALLFVLAACLLGCPGDRGLNSSDDDDAGPSDDDDASPADDDDATEAPVPELPGYSGEACPTMDEGRTTGWASGDDERDFRLLLPDDPEGAPLIFAWHWLGGSADDIVNYMSLEDYADRGAVVIAPDSRGLPVEWDSLIGPEGNADLTLFDDLLTCAWEQFGVDVDRVHSFGMSAGGLWSTYLTMHRAQWHASTAPLSGGADVNTYVSPAAPIPVLVSWGGPSDVYATFSFDTSSRYLIDHLREDGHFVAECMHNNGHQLPPGSSDYLWTWFDAHERGADGEPFEDGLPDSFPSFCGLDVTP